MPWGVEDAGVDEGTLIVLPSARTISGALRSSGPYPSVELDVSHSADATAMMTMTMTAASFLIWIAIYLVDKKS